MDEPGEPTSRPLELVGTGGRPPAVPALAPEEQAQLHRRRRIGFLVALAALAVALVLIGFDPLPVLVAVAVAGVLLRIGFVMLGMFVRPAPEPAPPGELRKVKIAFRCGVCGAEARMTAAPEEDPEPPRHCMQEMELVVPID